MGPLCAAREVNLVCSSLRHRQAFNSTIAVLLQADPGKWKEAHLRSHDISVVLPDPFIEDDSEIFRFILLSSVDLERSHQATTLNRIQQLFEFTHGDNIAVLFLLCDDASNSSQPSMGPFMELHIQLSVVVHLAIPIIPLATLPLLPSTLAAFLSAFTGTASSIPPTTLPSASELIPSCTIYQTPTAATSAVPVSQTLASMFPLHGQLSSGGFLSSHPPPISSLAVGHTTASKKNDLTDLFPCFRALLEDGLATVEGRRLLRQWVGQQSAEGMESFWMWEFPAHSPSTVPPITSAGDGTHSIDQQAATAVPSASDELSSKNV